jgi:hypothetical protein
MNDHVDISLDLNPQAWAVLHFLAGIVPNAFGLRYDKEIERYQDYIRTLPWYNGRERGFRLEFGSDQSRVLHVCFAENRSSDDIVVYNQQGSAAFNPQDFKPTEEFWRTRRCFAFGMIGDVADYIKELALGWYSNKED